jgi:hypothetical protein
VKLHIEISLSAAEVRPFASRPPALPSHSHPQYQIPLATDLFAVLRSVCDTLATRGNSGEAPSFSLSLSLSLSVASHNTAILARTGSLAEKQKITIFIIIFFLFPPYW